MNSFSSNLAFFILPGLFLVTLNFPYIFHRNQWTKWTTLLILCAASLYVVLFVELENPTIAYLTGLMTAWYPIWSSFLLFTQPPWMEFQRVKPMKSFPLAGRDKSTFPYEWQTLPQVSFPERLDWTMDLLFGFRGIGWSYGAKSLCMGQPKTETAETKPNGVTSLILITIRFLFDCVWVVWCRRWLGPWIKIACITLRTDLGRDDVVLWIVTRLTQTIVVPTMLFSIIDSVHCLWTAVYALKTIRTGVHQQYLVDGSSPWGSWRAVAKNGLGGTFASFPTAGFQLNPTGFWGGLWQTYFRLGLAKTTELLLPQPSRPSRAVRLTRLWIAFLLSAYLHVCASYMMSRKSNRLVGVLLFFLLQALGITIETMFKPIVVQILKGNERLMTLFNFFFCFVWLIPLAGVLVNDDMVLGGFVDGQRA
jgi:hypothetical protein